MTTTLLLIASHCWHVFAVTHDAHLVLFLSVSACVAVVAGEVATGKNRQLASVDALAARDSMGAIPGIGDAVPTLPQGAFPHPSGWHLSGACTLLP